MTELEIFIDSLEKTLEAYKNPDIESMPPDSPYIPGLEMAVQIAKQQTLLMKTIRGSKHD